MHYFAPSHQGQFRNRAGELKHLTTFDVCACGAKRWSEVMAWVANAYAQAATS